MDDHLRQTTNEQENNKFEHVPGPKLHEEENEWTQFENEDFQPSETTSGIIVARLPDLGESDRSIASPTSERSVSLLRYGRKWYIGFSSSVGRYARSIRTVITRRENGKQDEPKDQPSKKKFYSGLIAVGVVFLVFGIVLIVGGPKSSKKVATAESSEKADQNLIVQKENNSAAEQKAKEAADAAELAAKKKAEAEQKAKETAAAELAAKQQAEKLKAEQAANDAAKNKAIAEQKAKEATAAAELAAKKQAEQKSTSDSPWERPVSGDYSPWTMNSTQRMDAAASNATKHEADQTARAATVSPNNAALAPMSPIPQIPSSAPVASSAQSHPVVASPVSGNVYPQIPIQQQNYPVSTTQTMPPSGFASSSQYSRSPQPAVVSQPYSQSYPLNQGSTPMPIARSTVAPVPSSGRIPIAETPKSYQTHYTQYSTQYSTQHSNQYGNQYANQHQAMPAGVPYVAASPVYSQTPNATVPTKPYIPSPGPYPSAPAQAPAPVAGQIQQQNVYQNHAYQQTNYHVPATTANYPAVQPQVPMQQATAQHQYQHAQVQQSAVGMPMIPQASTPITGGAYPQGVVPTTQSRLY